MTAELGTELTLTAPQMVGTVVVVSALTLGLERVWGRKQKTRLVGGE